jgi:hypothetical protein
VENLKERDHLKISSNRTILQWLVSIQWLGVEWVHVTQQRERWWNLVNRVIKLEVP